MLHRGIGFAIALTFLFPGLAYAYPTYVTPSYPGATYECTDCHVHPSGGGGCNVSGAHPLRPCLNPFGFSYFNSGWSASLSSADADGDTSSNGTELPSANSAGLHNSAAARGCNMQTAATNPGVWQNCSTNNVQILATYSATGRNHYSFSFRCRPGSSGTVSGTGTWDCNDINECSTNRCTPGTCNQYALSSWVSPGYYCTNCGSGRTASSGSGCTNGEPCCRVTNECLANVDTCIAIAPCSDPTTALGDYVCDCPNGYTGNGRSPGTGCTNINECTTMSGVCGMGMCMDLTPGYTCMCNTGYTFNGTTCVVTNVCAANTDDCSRYATCTPVGTTDWTCTCQAGFTGAGSALHGTGDVCNDINECTRTPQPCGVGMCANTPIGTYTCTCPSGYRGMTTGGTCVDIDECMENPTICGVGTCTDRDGSYTCACPPGYAFTGGTCTDIDECATAPCGAGGSCVQTDPPGYTCNCNDGYTYDGTTCVDVLECNDPLTSLCSSNADCIEMVGSFECRCHTGYEGDGRSCVDIDECARDLDDCDVNAMCMNAEPAWTCMCNPGWEGSGVTCTDVDECATGTGGCEITEQCVNLVGLPNDCECRPGLTRQPDGSCAAACGDGARGAGEECDDGNPDGGDGCSTSCAIEPGWACFEPGGGVSQCTNTCGDGLVDAAEECDDGSGNSDTTPDACRTNCRRAGCGDAVLDTGEACDEGDANSDSDPDACRTSCESASCGDGVVDTSETCDPGGGGGLDPSMCSVCAGDAGVDGGAATMDGGCGCRASHDDGPPLFLLLVALALVLRRRRYHSM